MYRHLLIATDGSEISDHAITQGAALAKALGAKATIVTVTELWSPAKMADEVKLGGGFPVADFEKAAADAAANILTAARALAEKSGVTCETVHVADQRPADGVNATAKAHGCDAIVVATHGRTGLRRMLIGSQAAEIIATASVPVLVVR